MKRVITFTPFNAETFALVNSIPVVHAETAKVAASSACVDLVKECFAYGTEARSECFYRSSNHSSCRGSTLSEIVLKRWALTPSEAAPDNHTLNFVGTQLMNNDCVEQFDSRLSSWIVQASDVTTRNDSELKELSNFLSSCDSPDAASLSRP